MTFHLKGNFYLPTSIKKITDEQKNIVFNIAGGQNFQVAASLYSILTLVFHIVYPENYGIHKITMDNELLKDYKLLLLPKLVDVFSLQGIRYSKKNTLTHELAFVSKHYKFKTPGVNSISKAKNTLEDLPSFLWQSPMTNIKIRTMQV